VYSRADGMPNPPQSMVVCDSLSLVSILNALLLVGFSVPHAMRVVGPLFWR
jgi:hypothetical protein